MASTPNDVMRQATAHRNLDQFDRPLVIVGPEDDATRGDGDVAQDTLIANSNGIDIGNTATILPQGVEVAIEEHDCTRNEARRHRTNTVQIGLYPYEAQPFTAVARAVGLQAIEKSLAKLESIVNSLLGNARSESGVAQGHQRHSFERRGTLRAM